MLRFLLLRLKHASCSEILFRARQRAGSFRIKRWARSGRRFPVPEPEPEAVRLLVLPAGYPAVTWERVEALLEGERFTLNTDAATLRAWERAHAIGAPGAARGDLRTVWEPARLQHLALLLAYPGSGDDPGQERARRYLLEDLMRWLDAHPFPFGPHYLSAMECGLRIPVFLGALKAGPDPGELRRLGEALYLHARWIEANLSLYSSLGNHTVCEALGLLYAGTLFRTDRSGARWLDTGCRLLDQELCRQVLPDGGALEQSLSYHRFVLDLYWLALGFIEGNGLGGCPGWRERLTAGESFLAAVTDSSGGIPALGDSDDGWVIAPGLQPERAVVPPPPPGVYRFPDAGYTVYRGQELLITFDHGPLGMPPLNNHGHADALSVTVSLGGIPFLVDPGTFRYNGEPVWRRYFKGTRAHNTVCVDGADQAVQQTGFVWSSPFACSVEGFAAGEDGSLLVAASHDGYLRLPGKVRHRRTLQVAPDGTCRIEDRFLGGGTHRYELNFHFHPEVEISRGDGCWLARRGGRVLALELSGGVLRRGEEEPPLGWFSAAYNRKEPAPVLQAGRQGVPGEVVFQTILRALQ
ncbi:alginate lyase family protein [Geomesophilobacter sediminis]|uniref:Alginate lyase family protein n=1 Tax=Geomesophilobacter sediminis TaxID=2798584 RepID=A0A8J7IWZ6_9BACT|nr:alginate lyase family protein [Geomesophilobacter sediminis]MBJ6724247.1 alginate lyase family protein [Geomesophilobacter sediminis]